MAVSGGLVAIAVVVSDRHVLVGRRADNTPPWTFLGGKVEPGETAEAAAVREVREEAQLAIVALRGVDNTPASDVRSCVPIQTSSRA